ncbi:OmpA family protein [Streptomonospora alba]|uniref:OmpA family protein n=1 Tax=Streptomonospora alba TaxID=183763 RepID=UPI001EE6FDA9|nr:OmpA family protein [Streptomonospora alba]
MQIDVHSLVRKDERTVLLNFSMRNMGANEDIPIPPPPKEGSAPDLQTFALLDGTNSSKHFPLIHQDGTCYCSSWTQTHASSGEDVSAWIAFPAPPQDVQSMTLISAITPPLLDLPITKDDRSSEQIPSGDLKDPAIWEIRSFTDDLEGDSSREETDESVSISLSTDVLFDTGKSELDETANESVAQVAQEIEDSSDSTIDIDGHTDNTGSEAINDPLSEDRAAAVKTALKEAMETSDVKFTTAGHGSSEPIATNDTEEGRTKNRRVTITFEK